MFMSNFLVTGTAFDSLNLLTQKKKKNKHCHIVWYIPICLKVRLRFQNKPCTLLDRQTKCATKLLCRQANKCNMFVCILFLFVCCFFLVFEKHDHFGFLRKNEVLECFIIMVPAQSIVIICL